MAASDKHDLHGPVSSGTGYADNVYGRLVDQWDNAPGLSDKDMGDVMLVDGDGNEYLVPADALTDEDTFLDWLDEQDIDPPGDTDWTEVGPDDEWWDYYDGFELYTLTFVAPVGYAKSAG